MRNVDLKCTPEVLRSNFEGALQILKQPFTSPSPNTCSVSCKPLLELVYFSLTDQDSLGYRHLQVYRQTVIEP